MAESKRKGKRPIALAFLRPFLFFLLLLLLVTLPPANVVHPAPDTASDARHNTRAPTRSAPHSRHQHRPRPRS